MATHTHTCNCGAPARPGLAPPVELELDDASLRLEGVPVWSCPEGHVELADADLAARIVSAVEERLLVASSRRLRRTDACGDCGAPLDLPGRATEVPVPLATPHGVVTPTLLVTMVRCPACARDQLDRPSHRAVPALVAAALDHVRSGVPPG